MHRGFSRVHPDTMGLELRAESEDKSRGKRPTCIVLLGIARSSAIGNPLQEPLRPLLLQLPGCDERDVLDESST